MWATSSELADLGVVEAAEALRRRECSSLELTEACLARIAERDGTHSFDGDPESINAWVRVYEEDARAAARAADERLAAGDAPLLCGVPIGLKDLYAVAGKPLTASSRVLAEVPAEDCAVWARLRAQGMVLLGHLHTHEFAVGGTTDQVGNPWALDRTAGGSSGGPAAALAAGMTPAATGTDTAGSLRIPSALCGTSTIKPTRGLLPLDGIVPLAPSLDHPGPMARTLADCAPLLDAMAGGLAVEPRSLAGLRLAVSPRVDESRLDPDVADAFDSVLDVLRSGGVTFLEAPRPDAPLRVGDDFLGVLRTELHAWHLRFADRRELYRPALREWVTAAEEGPPIDPTAIAERRRATTAVWEAWLRHHEVFALVEPTVPVVAWPRGDGYERAGSDAALISLTHYWDWTGFPAVALPAGLGRRSELPTSVSLIGAPGSDGALLGAGIALEHRLR